MSWGRQFEGVVTNWAGGVQSAAFPDQGPDNALEWARNASFELLGQDSAVVRKRRGLRLITQTASPSPIVGQGIYYRLEETGFTRRHLVVREDGRVGTMAEDGTFTFSSTAFFRGQVSSVKIVTAGNRAYVVARNVPATVGAAEGHGLVHDGATWTLHGIEAPDPPVVVTPTGTGAMNGSYDVAIGYMNSNKGLQSSRSVPLTVTARNEKLFIQWNPSIEDPQVDQVVVHLRNRDISETFYEVARVTASLGSVTIDVGLSDYNALVTTSPDEHSNDPLPSGVIDLVLWRNRLFAATHDRIYYSRPEEFEVFDPDAYEPVAPEDGQSIRALVPFGDDQLLICKDHSIYALSGDTPSDWVIRAVAPALGCIAPDSVVNIDGLAMWWSQDGPVILQPDLPQPSRIAARRVDRLLTEDHVHVSELHRAMAVVDRVRRKVLFAVPGAGGLARNIIIPFNYQLLQFEGIWEVMDLTSLVEDPGRNRIYAAASNGRVYGWWEAESDGVPATGTATGTFSSTSTSVSVLVGSGFSTSPDLAGLYVVAQDTEGDVLPRRRIASNTATQITLSSPWIVVPGRVYTYHIGGIDWQVQTRWIDQGAPFIKKRYEHLLIHLQVPRAITLWLELGYRLDASHVHRVSCTASPSSDIRWDVSTWDDAYWSMLDTVYKRIRLAHTGRTLRLGVRHVGPTPITLLKLGVRGEALTIKR